MRLSIARDNFIEPLAGFATLEAMTVVETVTSPPCNLGGPLSHRLLVLHGPEVRNIGRSVPLDARLRIGRVVSADELRLEDPEISRVHAEIEPVPAGGFVMRDVESRNGTYLNGKRLEVSHSLNDGDVIRIGSHVLLYQSLGDEACQRLLDPVASSSALTGYGPAIAGVRAAIRRAAPGAMPVLIVGETGVGKELVANAIHAESGRSGALVSLNCAALPETLAESELFGHVSGAFTGAQRRDGLLLRARGGTLFLDEVGEMPEPLQKKLLRVLSTGEVRAVGADQVQRVDVRIVAATNLELEAAVHAGSYRRDLYARLAAHVVRVPPLRSRKEDVLVLLHHFLRLRNLRVTLSADAAEALLVHSWPFNVRELEQMVGVLEPRLSSHGQLGLSELPEHFRLGLGERPGTLEPQSSLSHTVLGVRRELPPSKEELLTLLDLHDGNVSRVAAFFGKGRRQVYRWAKHLGVDVRAARAMQRAR